MARFVVRRLIAMILVMFIVSVLTFVMLVKIPGGDPGQRLAGRSATQAEVQQIEAKYGFNKPIYDAVRQHDEEHLHWGGVLVHAGLQRARRDQTGPAGDVVARDRSGDLLAAGVDRRGDVGGGQGRANSWTDC